MRRKKHLKRRVIISSSVVEHRRVHPTNPSHLLPTVLWLPFPVRSAVRKFYEAAYRLLPFEKCRRKIRNQVVRGDLWVTLVLHPPSLTDQLDRHGPALIPTVISANMFRHPGTRLEPVLRLLKRLNRKNRRRRLPLFTSHLFRPELVAKSLENQR